MRDADAGTPPAPPAFYLTTGASNSGWRPGGAEYGLFLESIPSAIKFSHMSAPRADDSDDEDACEEVPLAAMKAVGMKQLLPAAATERMQKGNLIEIENEEEVTPGRSETTFVYLRASAYDRASGEAKFVPARLRGRSRIDSLCVWLRGGGVKTCTVTAKNSLVLRDAELRSPNAVRITRLWRQSEESMSVVHLKAKEARNLEKQGVARLARLVAPGEVATEGTPGEPDATQAQRIAALEQRLAAAEQHRAASDQRLAASEQLVGRSSSRSTGSAASALPMATRPPTPARAQLAGPLRRRRSAFRRKAPTWMARCRATTRKRTLRATVRRAGSARHIRLSRYAQTAQPANAQTHRALATPHPSHQPNHPACNRAAGAVVAIALRRLSPERGDHPAP